MPKTLVDSLVGFVKAPVEGVCLVLVDERGFEEGGRKRKKSYIDEIWRIVEKKGALVELTPPAGQSELLRWIRREAKGLGFSISTRGAYFLLERVGENLMLLRQELEKLAGYSREGEVVDAPQVEEVVVSHKEERVYRLFDAIIAKDARKALSVLASAYRQGMHPLQILALLEREIFKVMDTKIMLEEGREPSKYERSARVARRMSFNRINEILSALLEADVSAKSVGLQPERVVELMVIKLCAKSPTHSERIHSQWRQEIG